MDTNNEFIKLLETFLNEQSDLLKKQAERLRSFNRNGTQLTKLSTNTVVALTIPKDISPPTKIKVSNDPNRPKKANAYTLFVQDEVINLKANPATSSIDNKELFKIIAEKWKVTSTATKEKYSALAEEKKKSYDEEMTAYKAGTLPVNAATKLSSHTSTDVESEKKKRPVAAIDTEELLIVHNDAPAFDESQEKKKKVRETSSSLY